MVNIAKNPYYAKQSATDALKIASKTAEETGDLIDNIIGNKMTKT